jgi:hypothetical protein
MMNSEHVLNQLYFGVPYNILSETYPSKYPHVARFSAPMQSGSEHMIVVGSP